MHTAIAIVRSLTVDCFGVAAELDPGLKLEVELKLEMELRLEMELELELELELEVDLGVELRIELGPTLDVGLNADMGLDLDVGLDFDMELNLGLDPEAGLKLDMELELGAEFRLRLPTTKSMTNEEMVARAKVDNSMLVVGEEVGKYDDCAMRSVGSREKRFIALSPKQQGSSKEPVVSQHIVPEAHVSEHIHTGTPLL